MQPHSVHFPLGSPYPARITSSQSPPLLPFTHARSESINADILNSNFLQLGWRSGGRPQRTVHPRQLPVNTVIHTTLVGFEPTTFRLLFRRAIPVVPPTHHTSLQQKNVIRSLSNPTTSASTGLIFSRPNLVHGRTQMPQRCVCLS